jgi:hypothetical protein
MPHPPTPAVIEPRHIEDDARAILNVAREHNSVLAVLSHHFAGGELTADQFGAAVKEERARSIELFEDAIAKLDDLLSKYAAKPVGEAIAALRSAPVRESAPQRFEDSIGGIALRESSR